jgi:hypothetical protein
MQWAIEGGNQDVIQLIAKHQFSAETATFIKDSVLV